MGNERIGGNYVVAATKDGRTELWAAATLRDEALALVQRFLPPGWKAAAIRDRRLTLKEAEALKLGIYGMVHEYHCRRAPRRLHTL
jgi:hypothetical protein